MQPKGLFSLKINAFTLSAVILTLSFQHSLVAQEEDPMDSVLEPKELFMKMVEADTTHSYEALFAFERAGQLATYRIENLAGESPEQNLNALNRLSPTQILSSSCSKDGSQSHISIENLANTYNFYRPEDGVVAGRKVSELLLLPLDEYRYGYGFSLDSETFLTLRRVILTPQREPIERYEFVDIDYLDLIENVSDEDLENQNTDCAESIEYLEESQWTALRLPDGFQLLNTSHDIESKEEELLITDGLTMVSVNLKPVDEPSFPQINTSLGATNIILRYIASRDSLYMATLVGEAPLISLEFIASGLNLSTDPNNTETQLN